MEYIKTNTGRDVNVLSCGSMHSILYVNTLGYGFADLVTIFNNPEETSHIDFYIGPNELFKSFDGYTKLSSIAFVEGEEMLVTLLKEYKE